MFYLYTRKLFQRNLKQKYAEKPQNNLSPLSGFNVMVDRWRRVSIHAGMRRWSSPRINNSGTKKQTRWNATEPRGSISQAPVIPWTTSELELACVYLLMLCNITCELLFSQSRPLRLTPTPRNYKRLSPIKASAAWLASEGYWSLVFTWTQNWRKSELTLYFPWLKMT